MIINQKGLLLLGASLYTCEGTRARIIRGTGQKIFAVEFTNKDPRTIGIFLRFLREVVKAEESRIKAELFIYPDHNEDKLKQFWSNITNIPLERFNQTIRLRQKNVKFNPNPLGTLKIRYHHKEHFLLIQNIIDKIFGLEKDSVI